MEWIKDFDNSFLSNKMYFKFERYKIYYRRLIENSQWLKYTKISVLGVQNRQNQIIKFINSKKIISFNRVMR